MSFATHHPPFYQEFDSLMTYNTVLQIENLSSKLPTALYQKKKKKSPSFFHHGQTYS